MTELTSLKQVTNNELTNNELSYSTTHHTPKRIIWRFIIQFDKIASERRFVSGTQDHIIVGF